MSLSESCAANRPAALVVGTPSPALRREDGLADRLVWSDVRLGADGTVQT
jgi:hypothetical protein